MYWPVPWGMTQPLLGLCAAVDVDLNNEGLCLHVICDQLSLFL
jgi:hypothetical protein